MLLIHSVLLWEAKAYTYTESQLSTQFIKLLNCLLLKG